MSLGYSGRGHKGTQRKYRTSAAITLTAPDGHLRRHYTMMAIWGKPVLRHAWIHRKGVFRSRYDQAVDTDRESSQSGGLRCGLPLSSKRVPE